MKRIVSLTLALMVLLSFTLAGCSSAPSKDAGAPASNVSSPNLTAYDNAKTDGAKASEQQKRDLNEKYTAVANLYKENVTLFNADPESSLNKELAAKFKNADALLKQINDRITKDLNTMTSEQADLLLKALDEVSSLIKR